MTFVYTVVWSGDIINFNAYLPKQICYIFDKFKPMKKVYFLFHLNDLGINVWVENVWEAIGK